MMAARRWEEDYDVYEGMADGTYGAGYADYDPSWEINLAKDSHIERSKHAAKVMGINTVLRNRCLAFFLVFSVLTLGLTALRGLTASRGYALVETRRQAERLEQENEALKVEIAHLKSPQRIKELAEQRLGMIVPQNVYYASEKKR